MKYRQLGRTDIEVSEIGFGAWGIGGGLWQDSNDKESMRALHKAADRGVNFIDTALAYGHGHSERLIGKFLKERTDPSDHAVRAEQIYVATKIPPQNGKWPAKGSLLETFSYKYIIECTEQSLKNLQLETIDVQQFHVWDDQWAEESEWYDAISHLKEQGKIRFFGISINDHQPENALKVGASEKIDTFQVIYNIFDQSPEDNLFPYCQERKIGIIARVPFDEGSLTGAITPETVFHEKDFRNDYFRGNRKQEITNRIDALKDLLDGEAQTLSELALRFCLHHPAVSTVIPGMRSIEHVESNCVVSDGRKFSEKLLAKLRNHKWMKNFYD